MTTLTSSTQSPIRAFESPAIFTSPFSQDEKKSQKKIYRKILKSWQTSSLINDENHDCSKVNIEFTIQKTANRIYLSMFRFSMAYTWECKTFRGPTRFNGARCHCGKCQSAHAALSPTLYDDKLERVMAVVKSIGYHALTKPNRDYLKSRFALKDEDKQMLSSENEADREKRIQHITSRLNSPEKKGSFINSSLDHSRNLTVDGPTSSNRVDCHLEFYLRPLEDRLADSCTRQEKEPKKALEELFLRYRQILNKLRANLPHKMAYLRDCKQNLETLNQSHKMCVKLISKKQCLSSISSELLGFDENSLLTANRNSQIKAAFATHLQNVQTYLKNHDLYFYGESKGAPLLKKLKESLNSAFPPLILRTLEKTYRTSGFPAAMSYFKSNIDEFKVLDTRKTDHEFSQGFAEIIRRLHEAKAQCVILNKNFEEVFMLTKMYFGEKDQNGIFRTPTKPYVEKKLNEQLVKKYSPSSSSSKRKRNRSEPNSPSPPPSSTPSNAPSPPSDAVPSTLEQGRSKRRRLQFLG